MHLGQFICKSMLQMTKRLMHKPFHNLAFNEKKLRQKNGSVPFHSKNWDGIVHPAVYIPQSVSSDNLPSSSNDHCWNCCLLGWWDKNYELQQSSLHLKKFAPFTMFTAVIISITKNHKWMHFHSIGNGVSMVNHYRTFSLTTSKELYKCSYQTTDTINKCLPLCYIVHQ